MNINEDSLEGSIESPKGKGKEPEIPDTLSKENLMRDISFSIKSLVERCNSQE